MIHDTVLLVVYTVLTFGFWDWVDLIVKVGVVDIMVTWFTFFIGMTIKGRISKSYRKPRFTALGKAISWIFVYLIDARCNRSILLNIICLDTPAHFNELVTHRAERYRRPEKLTVFLFSQIDSSYFLREVMSRREIWQHRIGTWLCKQMDRVDPGHCKDHE